MNATISKNQTVRGALEKLLSEIEMLTRAAEEQRQILDPILVPVPPRTAQDCMPSPQEPVSEAIGGIMLATERVRTVRCSLQDVTARAHL